MDFQFYQFVLFIVCPIGLIAFSAYSVNTVRRFGIASYLGELLITAKAIIGTTSKLVMGFISLMTASSIASDEEDNTEEGDLTGVYNFRTRKFDNGTDPYGWYEEDL